MTAVECSPNHFTLDVAHPLAHELHKSLFGDQTRRRTQLHDIYNLMEQPKLFRRIVHFLSERYRAMGAEGPTHILGLESRGYLLGVPLAMELGLPFVAARVTKRFPSSFIDEGGSSSNCPPRVPSGTRASRKTRASLLWTTYRDRAHNDDRSLCDGHYRCASSGGSNAL
ncbi:hypothetical protein ERJ75_001127600 [Trypanosoma vivax]|nr:hypothetical protein ERJ75_001127600 [Trypanosoma vivax]